MVWFLILVSSYLGFLLLRSRLSVLSRLALDSVHLLDGLLEAGEDDEALDEAEADWLVACFAPLTPPAHRFTPNDVIHYVMNPSRVWTNATFLCSR